MIDMCLIFILTYQALISMPTLTTTHETKDSFHQINPTRLNVKVTPEKVRGSLAVACG